MTRRLVARELRENGKWALIAFVIAMVVIFLRHAPGLIGPLGAAVVRRPVHYSVRDLVVGVDRIALPLLWPTGLMALFCTLWGAALGLVQTLPDRIRGTDQVLLALPVTRMRLFAVKAGTGIVLYVLSVGVPFGLLVARAASPGHYPSPFRMWMMGPGVAAIAGGLCAYGGAMLTVMRPARWYVSRAIPLIAAGGISLFTYRFAFFGAAAALVGAALMLWCTAVWLHTRSY